MRRITIPEPMTSGAVLSMTRSLKNRYPFIQTAPVGHTLLGRPIMGIHIGNGHSPILFSAAFHGQEWLTSLVLLRFCEDICHALRYDKKLANIHIKSVFETRSVIIVPQVNPDGADIAICGSGSAGIYARATRELGANTRGLWQANARGVDINHNFDAGWDILHEQEAKSGINAPAPRQWGGTAPESEPETMALVKLCKRAKFRHALALHSQGEEIYWEYGEHTPPASHTLAQLMGELSGYAVTSPTGLASHGGFKDWFIDYFHKPAFTVEMGMGENPLPLTDFYEVYDRLFEMLILLLIC